MKCTRCGGKTRVRRTFAVSGSAGSGTSRERVCLDCGRAFTTVETVWEGDSAYRAAQELENGRVVRVTTTERVTRRATGS